MMNYYEISEIKGLWVIWQVTNNGCSYTRIKSYKTKAGAENWAAKQWLQVIWR